MSYQWGLTEVLKAEGGNLWTMGSGQYYQVGVGLARASGARWSRGLSCPDCLLFPECLAFSRDHGTPRFENIAVGQLLAEYSLSPGQWDLVNTIRLKAALCWRQGLGGGLGPWLGRVEKIVGSVLPCSQWSVQYLYRL